MEVQISTYNGARWVGALLDSLRQQTYPNLAIRVRDDGSTDRTVDEVQMHAHDLPLRLDRGTNLGVPDAFWALLRETPPGVEYVAFCDQDDVWLPYKIERAVSISASHCPSDLPCLYCSRYAPVTENLTPIPAHHARRTRPSFENALVENIATGCTVLLNAAAVDLLRRTIPRQARMHDWWAYLVVSALGLVVFDPEPTVLYRQHGSNEIGVPTDALDAIRRRLRAYRLRAGSPLLTQQAAEFRGLYGDLLAPRVRSILDDFIDGRGTPCARVRYALVGRVRRQSLLDNVLLKLLILAGKI